jgi:hypothetical protein
VQDTGKGEKDTCLPVSCVFSTCHDYASRTCPFVLSQLLRFMFLIPIYRSYNDFTHRASSSTLKRVAACSSEMFINFS